MIQIGPFNVDTRVLFTVIWGVGTVVVWGMVLRKTYRHWRTYRDRRARHDVLTYFGLFMVAAASAAAIAFALFAADSSPGDPLRGFSRLSSAIALGAFFMSGVVKLKESPPTPDEA